MKIHSLSTLTGCGLLLLCASGCASVPEPKAVPNGEPLSIGEHTEKYRYTVKEKVGEVRHQDSHGRSTGKSTLYADRTKVGTLHTWNAYQGDEKISDDDLYRIAKDEEADREVRSMRENGVLMNRIGLGLTAAGILAGVGGLALSSQVKEGESSTLPQVLIYAGFGSATLGMILMYTGISKTKVEHPLDQERAARAADHYNERLGNQASK